MRQPPNFDSRLIQFNYFIKIALAVLSFFHCESTILCTCCMCVQRARFSGTRETPGLEVGCLMHRMRPDGIRLWPSSDLASVRWVVGSVTSLHSPARRPSVACPNLRRGRTNVRRLRGPRHKLPRVRMGRQRPPQLPRPSFRQTQRDGTHSTAIQ